MRIKNATVIRVNLGIEDHGILTDNLTLDYGDGGRQGFGGYALDMPGHPGRVGHAYGIDFILNCLKVCGVDNWENMPGKNIRVKINEKDLIEEVGHITKDIWFNPRLAAEKYKNQENISA